MLVQSLSSLKTLVYCEAEKVWTRFVQEKDEEAQEEGRMRERSERSTRRDESDNGEGDDQNPTSYNHQPPDGMLNGTKIPGDVYQHLKDIIDYISDDQILHTSPIAKTGIELQAQDSMVGEVSAFDSDDDAETIPTFRDSADYGMLEVKYPSRLFQPSTIVNQLLSAHGHALQRLALLSYNRQQPAIIERRFKIKHQLQAFQQLTHLELDVQVLKTQREGFPFLFPCLTAVLPHTIEVLGVIMANPSMKGVFGLFSSLPSSMSQFPSLQKVVLRIPRRDHSREGIISNLEAGLHRKLVQRFTEVGVDLIIEEDNFFSVSTFTSVRPKVVYGNETDPSAIDDMVEGMSRRL
jgi:hypothetical protein